jgi:hypothetical protein
MWKNTAELGMPQMTIWLMRISCWIRKSTNTHSECVIHIAFPLQQWLHKNFSLLRSAYVACLAYFVNKFRLCVSYESLNKYHLFKHSIK